MNNSNIEQLMIESDESILSALKKMNIIHRKLLIVVKDGLFHSLVSIGDIQRAIIADVDLHNPVKNILRSKVNVAAVGDNKHKVIRFMIEQRSEFMPIVDDQGVIAEIIYWDDVVGKKQKSRNEFTLPVVIMAGGKGTRLRPLTNVLPKPLIPLGEQTIMEDIMDRFVECGCHNFYVSVNYKADTIRRYFDNLNKPQYHVEYFQEDKPLGTAGSLHLLKDRINSTFFVSNCDIIIDEDYSEILKFHCDKRNEITVVGAIKNYSIPYGTLETGSGGQLLSLQEKPEL